MTNQAKKELKNLESKYKIITMCILCTLFALLVPFWNGFVLCFWLVIAIASLFFSVQEAFSLYVYSYFFTGLLGFDQATHTTYCILLIGVFLKYVYHAIRGKEIVAKWPIVVSVFFYMCAIMPLWNYKYFFGIAMPLMFLGAIYLIYIYRDRIDGINLTKCMFAGLVASAVLGIFLAKIFNIPEYSFIEEAERMQYFTTNANTIGFAGVIIVAGFIISMLKLRVNWWTGILYCSITIFFAAQSGSKAFLLSLSVLVFITLLILLFKNKKVGLIATGAVIASGIILFFCFRGYFDYMMNRFLFSGVASIESVTTGRWEIWLVFLKNQFQKPINVILGMGAWTEMFLPYSHNTMWGCHSIYIEFFYYFGVVGIINLFLLMWAYSYTTQKRLGKVKLFVKVEDVLPLLMVFVLGVGERVVFNRKCIFLIVALIFIFNGSKHIPVESNKLQRAKHIKQLKNQKMKGSGV